MDEPQYFPPWLRVDTRLTAEIRLAAAVEELADIREQIRRHNATRAIRQDFKTALRELTPGERRLLGGVPPS